MTCTQSTVATEADLGSRNQGSTATFSTVFHKWFGVSLPKYFISELEAVKIVDGISTKPSDLEISTKPSGFRRRPDLAISTQPSGFRLRQVGDAISKGKDHLFKPKVARIGSPGNGDSKDVESCKDQVLKQFWSEDKEMIVDELVEKNLVYWFSEQNQKSYRDDGKSFVGMCGKDGCFVSFIMDVYANKKPSTLIGRDILELCINDMFLVENQLPWPLLDRINTMIFGENGRKNVIKFLYAVMERRFSDSLPQFPSNLFDDASDLLDLTRRLCVEDYSCPEKYPFISYSAEDLYLRGVKISGTRPKEHEGILVGGMEFSKLAATLVVPFLPIHNVSRFLIIFRNMIALEGTPGVSSKGEITTFIHVIAALLRDSNSVTIAREKFISTSAGNETIVNLFKELSADSYPDDAIYANAKKPRFGVICKLKVWGRELYETCFNSPYKVLFVLGPAVAIYLQRVESVAQKGWEHR